MYTRLPSIHMPDLNPPPRRSSYPGPPCLPPPCLLYAAVFFLSPRVISRLLALSLAHYSTPDLRGVVFSPLS